MLLPSFVTLAKGSPRRCLLKITLLVISTYILISFFFTQRRIWSHVGNHDRIPSILRGADKVKTNDETSTELSSDPILRSWQSLRANAPRQPKEDSETWIIDQAFYYDYIRKLRDFKEKNLSTSSTTISPEVTSKITSDIRHHEGLAFSFLRDNHGLDTVKQFHRNSEDPQQRRGLVIVAGKKQYRFLLHLLTSLRQVLNSSIPVEVFYRGDKDLSSKQLSVLQMKFTNVTTRNLLAIPIWNEEQAGLKTAGFALKPFAMLASRFAEPILCDADTIFLQDPYKLYEEKMYKDTGTLFFHDRAIYSGWHTRGWVRSQFNLTTLAGTPTEPSKPLEESWYWKQPTEIHHQESGVVLVDKSRDEVLLACMLITWMNSRLPREYLRKYMWGDKETFWVAFEFLKIPYSFVSRWGGAIGKLEDDMLSIDNILHFDSGDRPLWLNGGLLRTKFKRTSPWLVVDTYALDDGRWRWGWTYSKAKWKKVPELGELFVKMTKAAEEMEDLYWHRNFIQWTVDWILDKCHVAI